MGFISTSYYIILNSSAEFQGYKFIEVLRYQHSHAVTQKTIGLCVDNNSFVKLVGTTKNIYGLASFSILPKSSITAFFIASRSSATGRIIMKSWFVGMTSIPKLQM
mmetsp:Transcript_2845/g.4241  ORF Transcript_2845/g.4241 Transcript_2845/m.4241 type:complete len:106 (+) Transcript_2845:1034-1351(+)